MALSTAFGGMDAPLFTGFTGFADPFLTDFVSRALKPVSATITERRQGPTYPMDVIEHPANYSIIADCPGMTVADIHVELLEDGILSIRGRKKRGRKKHDRERETRGEMRRGIPHMFERPRTTHFNRNFTLPDDASADQITAIVDNGVLTVTIPKKPRAGAKKIPVHRVTPKVTGSHMGTGAETAGAVGPISASMGAEKTGAP